MPYSTDYQPNSTLSELVVTFPNFKGVADEIAPVLDCDARGMFYYETGASDDFDDWDDTGGDDDSVGETKSRRTRRSVDTIDITHSEFLPVVAEEEGQLIGLPEIDMVTQRVYGVVMRKREKRVATAATTAGNYNYTGTPAVKWGTATVKQIQTDINTALDSLVAPEGCEVVMLMGLQAWRSLSTNANVIAVVTPTKAATQLTEAQIAELFGVDRVVVGKMKTNTTNVESDTPTRSNIWGDVAVIYYKTPKPTRASVGFAQTFRRKVYGRPINVYLLPVHRGAHGGTLVKVSMTERPFQPMNKECAFLYTAVSA